MICTTCDQENPEGMTFCGNCGARLDAPPDDTPRQEFLSDDFVGRQREMGDLIGSLDGAFRGQGRLVMLVGDPGIGKTRTAQELSAIAEQRGAKVLWGRCHEQQGMPPYWPWVQAIRDYVQGCEPEQLRSDLGNGAANIGEIVPEVREKLPGIDKPSSTDSPEQARFRLFDSITTFLRNASQVQPIVIVLDNLHWADRPSLLLLEFLGQELEVAHLLVLGTHSREQG